MSKTMSAALMAVLVSIVSLQTANADAVEPGLVSYANWEFGFTVELPAGWKTKETRQWSDVTATRPAAQGALAYRDSIDLQVLDMTKKMSAQEFLEVLVGWETQSADSYAEAEKGTVTTGAGEAPYAIYINRSAGKNKDLTLKAVKYIVSRGMRAYCITCAALPEAFDAGRPLFDKVAASFALGTVPLDEARRSFKTKLTRKEVGSYGVPQPPAKLFRVAYYQSPAGKLPAYISQVPKDGKKRPAIIWIVGGPSNTISPVAWQDAPADDDQSASAYRKAGVVTMLPALRGGNDNKSPREAFLGEVDDVLAAADFLAKQEGIDAGRIYLGGHSTGGTLALLVAECSDRFRAVFSFGPVGAVSPQIATSLPFDTTNIREIAIRSPGYWLSSVRSPVFIFEGTEKESNIDALRYMARTSNNPMIRFYGVKGVNHFSILAPVNTLIATRILQDKGTATSIAFSNDELNSQVRGGQPRAGRAK